MTTVAPAPTPRHSVMRSFDERVGRALGVDFRLLYGIGVPLLAIVGLVVILGFHPSQWLVASIMVVEVGCLGLVLKGIFGILDGEDVADDSGD